MENLTLDIETSIQVQKPPQDVFEAITDPLKMSGYFISRGSGRLEEGKQIMWQFPEFEMEFPIRVSGVVKDKYVSFYWEVDGEDQLVEINLSPRGSASTIVRITEKSRQCDEAGIKWLQGNTAGWANFLACLKAYLEYGINLRKGAFDFLADK
ncbi:MAG: SRPBCC domain-containing protein [Bacteroidales bacterium]